MQKELKSAARSSISRILAVWEALFLVSLFCILGLKKCIFCLVLGLKKCSALCSLCGVCLNFSLLLLSPQTFPQFASKAELFPAEDSRIFPDNLYIGFRRLINFFLTLNMHVIPVVVKSFYIYGGMIKK